MDLVLQRSESTKVKAFPSLDVVPLMVTMVEHVDMQRDYVVTKSVWHISDATLKSVCESRLILNSLLPVQGFSE